MKKSRILEEYTIETICFDGEGGVIRYRPECVELTFQQVDDTIDAIIVALKSWLPPEAQTPAVIEDMLKRTKDRIDHLITNL